MAVQTYLIHLHDALQQDDAARDELADLTIHTGGFVLMATDAGSLIAALDDRHLPAFRQHRAVAFCGAVRLDPNGAAATRLQQLFAANIAAQLAHRLQPTSASADRAGPRYRPLCWHLPDPDGARAATSTETRQGVVT